MKKFILFAAALVAAASVPPPARGQVRFAAIFSDSMVIQARQPVRVWGRAGTGERIVVTLNDTRRQTKADRAGAWSVEFPAVEYGESVSLQATGGGATVEIAGAVTGDVWLCSGQSNMQMTVNGPYGRVDNFMDEVSSAAWPDIRSFNVTPVISTTPAADVEGRWEVCSPRTVADFSAVAYFFAREINRRTGIPIGIVNSSWGGTAIETWMSPATYRTMPEHIRAVYAEVDRIGADAVLQRNADNRAAFERVTGDDPGTREQWYSPSLNVSTWEVMAQPGEWSAGPLAGFDGVAWFRFEFDALPGDADKPATLSLGKIDDNDDTWINGVKVGRTTGAGYDRMYDIPEGVLRAGRNVVAVKVVDAIRGGGFTSAPKDLYIAAPGGRYSLAGEWRYRTSVDTGNLHFEEFVPNLCYGLLYNAMIDPLRRLGLRGVIWYQGETNAGQAWMYRTLFPALIADWRRAWGRDDLPFYWVQLASYLGKAPQPPAMDAWAELREAQTMTLAVENTGQAVTTDIGDATDIHPRNKQEVGRRLALIALNKLHGESETVFTGPLYKSATTEGAQVTIRFEGVAGGLRTSSKYGYVEGFAIAGADGRWVWASARIEEPDKVVVRSPEVAEPVAVRYCWSINPDVNLFNSAGLPATPFRTDDWKISSQP